jgi:type IV secretory pathway protease TraF
VRLAGAVACLGAHYIHPPIRIFYNASPSIARGWHVIVPRRRLKVGMLVIAHIPPWAARLAADRDYLPITVPVIKCIAAVDGESVCEQSERLAIDGHVVARALTADSAGRPLPAWHGCRALDRGEFLLVGDTWDSYDSRCFDPITAGAAIGRAIPLWTRQ